MISKRTLRTTVVVLASLASSTAPAFAGAGDYEFQLVETNIKQGAGAILAVRLLDKRSGDPVPDAVIFATRLDMAPDGMETMITPVEAMPSEEPGVYRFKTTLTMAGGWQFSLAAKVQGEAETVAGKLVLKAVQ